jgi:hypothetical protein
MGFDDPWESMRATVTDRRVLSYEMPTRWPGLFYIHPTVPVSSSSSSSFSPPPSSEEPRRIPIIDLSQISHAPSGPFKLFRLDPSTSAIEEVTFPADSSPPPPPLIHLSPPPPPPATLDEILAAHGAVQPRAMHPDLLKLSPVSSSPAAYEFDVLELLTGLNDNAADKKTEEESAYADIKDLFGGAHAGSNEMTVLVRPAAGAPEETRKYSAGEQSSHFDLFDVPAADWRARVKSAHGTSRAHPPAFAILLGHGRATGRTEDVHYYDAWNMPNDPINAGTVFQAASNFNSLEQTSPDEIPGAVKSYFGDNTQGPILSLGAHAATLWRRHVLGEIVPGDPRRPDARSADEWSKYPAITVKGSVPGVASTVRTTVGGWLDMTQAAYDADWKASIVADEIAAVADAARFFGCWQVRGCHSFVSVDGARKVGIRLDPPKIHQVFSSAVDLQQMGRLDAGATAEYKAFSKAALLASYWNALKCAQRIGASSVVLTLMGGGVFGNAMDDICDMMVLAFKEFFASEPSSGITQVALVLWESRDRIDSYYYDGKKNDVPKGVPRRDAVFHNLIASYPGDKLDWMQFIEKTT